MLESTKPVYDVKWLFSFWVIPTKRKETKVRDKKKEVMYCCKLLLYLSSINLKASQNTSRLQ